MSAVVLLPYSARWPEHFVDERAQLAAAFGGEDVEIAHIGSTAVPGLCAKPVLDVLLGAESLSAVEAQIPALAAIGYVYVPKYERELPQRRYFTRDAALTAHGLRVHLHAVVRDGALWREHLAFRDALRADADLRDAYDALKRELARTHAHDKAAYTEAKSPFIRGVQAAALRGG
jgi:GrpB-like predicted nucleotidyltransferase (UPF0157 family)